MKKPLIQKIYSYTALVSMVTNLVSPFAAVLPSYAFAEDITVPATEEVVVEETPSEVTDLSGEASQSEAQTETGAVIEVSAEEVSSIEDQTGDILLDGVTDYQPLVEIENNETTEVQDIPNESITEEPKEEVKEYETLADGVEIKDSVEENWNVDGEKAETKEIVKLGVKYIFPLEEDVSITFTKLPKLDEDRSTLKIERVKVSDLNLPDDFKTDAEYAFDITTDMENGEFEYDLTLPKPEGVEAEVSYIEKSIEEAKDEVKSEDVKDVDVDKIEQNLDDEDIKVKGLDHFTIVIATYSSSSFSTTKTSYLQGETVYAQATGLQKNNSTYYRIDIIESDGTTKHNIAACQKNIDSKSGSYALPSFASLGTWSAVIEKHDDSSECNNGTDIKDTGTATFTVTAGSYPDLVVTKTNNVSGSTTNGQSFIWTLTVTNNGTASVTFNNQDILQDNLPSSGATYTLGSVTLFGGVTGTIRCNLSGDDLDCDDANGGVSVVIPVGGSFSVPITVLTTAVGSLVNPRTGGSSKCQVDPDGLKSESNEVNNTCSDTVTVATVQSVSNPSLSQACGLDIALIIDNSTSIDAGELAQIKNAMTAFTDALAGTPTQFSVTKFATTASVVQSFTNNIATVNAAINSIPVGGGYTNWEDGFIKGWSTFDPRSNPNLVIFASDGNPNRVDNGTSASESQAVSEAQLVANAIKTAGIRILALGIGDELDTPNLQAISGNEVNTGDVLTSDVITSNFDDLADDLADFASQTCGGTITVNKYINSVAPENRAGAGWDFDIAGTSKTTDSNGQTDAVEVSAGSGYSVTESSVLSGYTFGSAICTGATNNGTQSGNGVVGIEINGSDIVSCDFVNTENYIPTRICHATAANPNPYVSQTPATLGQLMGHADHTGPVWYLGIDVQWGDIIPPIPVFLPTGLNWSEGQAIWNNDCNIPPQTGSILIHKFEDATANGVIDAEEHGLENWQMGIYSGTGCSGQVILNGFQYTDNKGDAQFDDLAPGQYSVKETSQTGWYTTTPECQNVTVVTGQVASVNVGNYEYSRLWGYKFEDINGNGIWDDDEKALEGWTIYLDLNANGVLDPGEPTDITDASGMYEFIDLEKGQYHGGYSIREVLESGWTQTYPEGSHWVSSTSGSIDRKDFGNMRTAYCGDGVKNQETEECDGTDGVTADSNFCTSTCKLIPIYDGNHACSDNKRPVLINTYTIDSTDSDGMEIDLTSGQEYLFKARGTYVYDNNTRTKFADAAYGTGDSWATTRNDIGIWGTNKGVISLLADLGNGVGVVEWDDNTTVNHGHEYYKAYTPTQDKVKFLISDWYSTWYNTNPTCNDQGCMGDNNGGLTLEVYECKEPPVTIKAYKIVCTDESDLPNWGQGGPYDIDEDTAINWVNDKEHETCSIVTDWKFQWSYDKVGNPGDNIIVEAGAGWNTFEVASGDDFAMAEIFNPKTSKLWFREVLQDGYIPFTYGAHPDNSDNVSAEFYCNNDVLNYDNWEWINNPKLGSTYYCVGFNTPEIGSIQGRKYEDLNSNSIRETSESYLDNWLIRLYDSGWTLVSEMNTGDDNTLAGPVALGQYRFENLPYGTYYICEVEQEGWSQTDPSSTEGFANHSGAEDEYQRCRRAIIDEPNELIEGKSFGNVQLTDIHGYKWNDLNGNGERDCINGDVIGDSVCELEPLLPGWKIFIDEDGNNQWDDGEQFMLTDSSDGPRHFGWYWFEDLPPGEYTICEEIQAGWTQTFPGEPVEPMCHVVTLPSDCLPGPGRFISINSVVTFCEFNFGNMEESELYVSETNDSWPTTLGVGDTFTYTIQVRATKGPVDNVQLVNLPPEGIEPQGGTFSAVSSVRGALDTSGVVYTSPGEWNLGNMEEDEVVIITYTAKVESGVDSGIYPDLSFAQGRGVGGSDLIALSESSGFSENGGIVNDNFVGTKIDVNVEKSLDDEVDVEEEEEEVGEVLGASTSLPATGAATIVVYILLALAFLGGLLLVIGGFGKMLKAKKIISILMIVFGFGLLSSKGVYAVTDVKPVIRIEEPKDIVNNEFKITFVVMDTENRPMIARCFADNPGGGEIFYQFGSDIAVETGGSSYNCAVGSSVLSAEGIYTFKVEIIPNPGDPVESEKVQVTYDGEGPDRPKSIEKDKDGSCTYEITVKTANDGQTAYVKVYREFDKEINIDSSSEIRTITMGPDEEHTFDETLSGSECDETPYYAVVAFDSAGNASDPRAEEVVTKVTVTSTESSEEENSGAIPTSGGSVLGEDQGLQGETVESNIGDEEQPGNVLGEEIMKKGGLFRSPFFWLVLVVLAVVIIGAKKKKKQK